MSNSYTHAAAEKALSEIKMSPTDIKVLLPVLMKMYQFEINRVQGYGDKELIHDIKGHTPVELKNRILKFATILNEVKNNPINDLFMSLRKCIRECNISIMEIEKNNTNKLLEDRAKLNGQDTKLYNNLINSYIQAKAIFTQAALCLSENDPKRGILLDADKMINAIAFSLNQSEPIQRIKVLHEKAAKLTTELVVSGGPGL